jgi:hypothetical protein
LSGKFTAYHAFKFSALVCRQGGHARLPCDVFIIAALTSGTPGLLHIAGYFKRTVHPAQQVACGLCIFGKQATAVAAPLALEAGNALSDHGTAR